jgi:hypothetical protein
MAPRYNPLWKGVGPREKNAVRHGCKKPCATTTLIVDVWSSNGVWEEASQLSCGFGSRSMHARGS